MVGLICLGLSLIDCPEMAFCLVAGYSAMFHGPFPLAGQPHRSLWMFQKKKKGKTYTSNPHSLPNGRNHDMQNSDRRLSVSTPLGHQFLHKQLASRQHEAWVPSKAKGRESAGEQVDSYPMSHSVPPLGLKLNMAR